jgi:hypothetical protein
MYDGRDNSKNKKYLPKNSFTGLTLPQENLIRRYGRTRRIYQPEISREDLIEEEERERLEREAVRRRRLIRIREVDENLESLRTRRQVLYTRIRNGFGHGDFSREEIRDLRQTLNQLDLYIEQLEIRQEFIRRNIDNFR